MTKDGARFLNLGDFCPVFLENFAVFITFIFSSFIFDSNCIVKSSWKNKALGPYLQGSKK